MKKIINLKTKIAVFLALITMIILTGGNFVFASGTFQGGNIFLSGNTANPGAGWGDPTEAKVGDIIQFKVDITNNGPDIATAVQVTANLPANIAEDRLTANINISSSNTPAVGDTAVVHVSSDSIPAGATLSLIYFPGHAAVISNSGTAPLPDTIASGGVAIPDVLVGASNFVEVTFKAQVVANIPPNVTPTPTPTVTKTPTPTPTGTLTPSPTVSPTMTPTMTPTGTVTPTPTGTLTPTPTGAVTITPTPSGGNVVQCPAGFVQTISGSTIICLQQIQGQSQSSTNNVETGDVNVNVSQGPVSSSSVSTVTSGQGGGGVPSVTQLPKTGLPLAAWLLSGFLPAGIGLKRFGIKGDKSSGDANYLCQKRRFQQGE